MTMLLPEKNQTVTHIFCFALFVAALPWVFGLSRATSYYTDVMVFVAIHSIIAAGLSLLLGYAGQISLGQAAFYGLGAYASGILTTRLGLSPWLGIMAGMALAAGLAYGVGLPALRLKGHYLAMATLGFGMIVYIVFNEFIGLSGGPSGFGEIPPIRIFGMEISSTLGFYYLAWTAAVGVLWMSLNMVHSRPGRALRAIHDSEKAAAGSGDRYHPGQSADLCGKRCLRRLGRQSLRPFRHIHQSAPLRHLLFHQGFDDGGDRRCRQHLGRVLGRRTADVSPGMAGIFRRL